MASFPSKRPMQETFRRFGAGFVRRVVAFTPPAKGTSDAAAKKAGEKTIANDLAKLMVPAAGRIKRALEDPRELWARSRDKSTGRVNPRNRAAREAVNRTQLAALKKELIAEVGLLASGFNAAAQELGAKLPAWVARHGTKRGAVILRATATSLKLSIINNVGFSGQVKGLERRIQAALNAEAASLERQAKATMQRMAKQAGFK